MNHALMERLDKRSLGCLIALLFLALCMKLLELRTGTITTYYPITSDMLSRPWLFLLPLDIGGGSSRWSTTGLVPISLLNKLIGPNPTLCAMSVLGALAAAITSWLALRSHVFSITLVLCHAVGTQFSYSYVNSSCVILYLYCMYVEVNLLCLYRAWIAEAPARLWRGLFVVSLVATALSWEMWLDYAFFLVILLGVGYLRARAAPDPQRRANLAFLVTCTTIVGVAFVLGKICLGGTKEHLRPGQEAELVLTYFHGQPFGAALIISLEDFLTNVFTFNYIAVTNFLPPWVIASNSLRFLGKDRIVALQSGYVPEGNELVYMHHVFLWYFAAGMVTLALYYALGRCIRESRTSVEARFLGAFLLLVVTGAFTHLFIKFRFYNSIPLYSYKCITGIVGVSLVIAYGLKLAHERLGARRGALLCGGAWIIIFYAGLARPPFMTELSRPIGQAECPYPCALSNAMKLIFG
jgi:hypothetical protein